MARPGSCSGGNKTTRTRYSRQLSSKPLGTDAPGYDCILSASFSDARRLDLGSNESFAHERSAAAEVGAVHWKASAGCFEAFEACEGAALPMKAEKDAIAFCLRASSDAGELDFESGIKKDAIAFICDAGGLDLHAIAIVCELHLMRAGLTWDQTRASRTSEAQRQHWARCIGRLQRGALRHSKRVRARRCR